jgi:hypothetical protein
MARESAFGVQAPYFFLSYHRTPADGAAGGEKDRHVYRLFDHLCRHIRHLTDLDSAIAPGYVDRETPAGAAWRAEIKKALAECQTFVALYEPRYFHSGFCGYEWDCFEARQALGRPPGSVAYSAIIPVLLVEEARLPDPLPDCASGLQYTDPNLPDSYVRQGIWGMLHGGSAVDYKRTTLAIARRIIEVAESTRIPPCDPDVFEDGADAFAAWRAERER